MKENIFLTIHEAKYYPNSKREPEKHIFDFRKKRPNPKIEPGKLPKEMLNK
jgi:hypothetical protein